MQWQAIAQMSKSPDFPAKFLAENFNDDMWTVSDPIGHLGIGFWYRFSTNSFNFTTTFSTNSINTLKHLNNSQHTVVYVLDWMDSENPLRNNGSFGVSSNLLITSDTYFYKSVSIDNNLTENITSLQHTEEVIRMRLAMNLLLGEHNSLKGKLEYDSTIAWMTKRYA
jgi:hypothetical protein